MTTVKTVSATTDAHVNNVVKYLKDERVIARASQHIINENRWDKEMAATREAYGHDKPARAGKATAYLYHQVLAFNPDECSMNGGKMTPEKCMAYARQWVEKRYPNQEAVWVLHREKCKADKTERFAVHLAINRTDLETGRRYNDGPSKNAKIERANAVRDLDREWGLKQVRANRRNSRVHARQPTRAEKEMQARGVRSDKQYIRDAITASMAEVSASPSQNPREQFVKSLEGKGVTMTFSKDREDFTFERTSTGFHVNGLTLGRGYSMEGIKAGVERCHDCLEVKIKRKGRNPLEDTMHHSLD